MAHLIRVYDQNGFVDELHRSGNLTVLYTALGANDLNQGTNGDGDREISRTTIADAITVLKKEEKLPEASFLETILDFSEEDIFKFEFM